MSNVRCAVRRRMSAWMESILHWDRRMVDAIEESQKLDKLERAFMTVTYLGDGYIWAALALGLLIFGDAVDRLYVGIGFVITVANIVIFRFIKSATGRIRPASAEASRLRNRIDGYSFPSGHATTAFGLAWVVFNCYPYLAAQAGVYFVAGTIALSRVIVREHYPLDVLGGAVLGSVVSAALFPLLMKLAF